MIYSDIHRFIFAHIPRTAGLSITQVIVKRLGGQFAPPLHRMAVPLKLSHYRRVVVVREPTDRLFSLWWAACHERRGPEDPPRPQILEGLGADEFVKLAMIDDYYAPQVELLDRLRPRDDDLVLPYEELPYCLEAVPGFEARFLESLPRMNPGERPYGLELPQTRAIQEYLEREYDGLPYERKTS